MEFIPTRAAGLARLESFTPKMGRIYAAGRNTDPGPLGRHDVSALSPWLRRRLLTEPDVIAVAQQTHAEASYKFVSEVAWRTYFKGWLEQHPSVWTAYLHDLQRDENRLASESGLRQVFHDACAGATGIDCFDEWATSLVQHGWLHNHSRMWFASIWIFTLRLPWTLGAAFFMRHLLDGDPASNTLSWRWVAGLHTRGKHYVARADNIDRYTDGRHNPRGQLDETPQPLEEDVNHPRVPLTASDPMPAGAFALLLHDDDLHPESLPLDLSRASAIAITTTVRGAEPRVAFVEGAIADTIARLGRPIHRLAPPDVADWVASQHQPVVTPWAPIGETASLLRDLPLARLRRPWDSTIWPHATRGFFQVRQRLPELLLA